uniref:B1292H11.8 protein n=1 Tax=Oryza sativa subsp. japonica TaxID=39947 RepID=Q6MWC3_ORYSJ|nr:B1292H11.8 [Oryza sativa Japonica Group]
MSTFANPSAAPSAEYAEHLSNLVAIPSLSHENHYFLGPIGNLDPTDFITGETNRIPFRLANPNLNHWKNTFKSWPSLEKTAPEKSWTTWYKRVSARGKTEPQTKPYPLDMWKYGSALQQRPEDRSLYGRGATIKTMHPQPSLKPF